MNRLNPLAEVALIGLLLSFAPPLAAHESAQSAVQAGAGLFATRWNLRAIDAKPLEAREGRNAPHLVIDGQGRLSGSGGCNRLMGSYRLEGSVVRFGPVATTMMACLSGGADEKRFLAALARVVHWRAEKGVLSLSDAQGREILRFSAEDPAP
ncbi:META domain-containing protein [Niveibacterium terrae]|uniref:META domain-containing protein n=1 Tax=Niveibacterium terrae TaxID=3373598 RepID=UPI003A93E9CC